MPAEVVGMTDEAEMAVAVAPELPRVEAPPREVAAETSGVIEIALPSGTTVRVSGRVDATVLRGVLAELGGR